jgi:hypothetical protein
MTIEIAFRVVAESVPKRTLENVKKSGVRSSFALCSDP